MSQLKRAGHQAAKRNVLPQYLNPKKLNFQHFILQFLSLLDPLSSLGNPLIVLLDVTAEGATK